MSSNAKAGKNAIPPGNQPGGNPMADAEAIAQGKSAAVTKTDVHAGPAAKERNTWQERQTEASRPIGSGGGKMRGDRRDTHADPGMRNNGSLRNDHNPTSTTGRQNNSQPNEGG